MATPNIDDDELDALLAPLHSPSSPRHTRHRTLSRPSVPAIVIIAFGVGFLVASVLSLMWFGDEDGGGDGDRSTSHSSSPSSLSSSTHFASQIEGVARTEEKILENLERVSAKLVDRSDFGGAPPLSPSGVPQNGKAEPVDTDSFDDLLLDEISFTNPTDLSEVDGMNLSPYQLHAIPDDQWVHRANHILEGSHNVLSRAQTHVNDPMQRVTVVTVLFDLHRDTLADVDNFKRPFQTYLSKLQRTVNIDFPMILFVDPIHVSSIDLSAHSNGLIIVPWSVAHLEDAYPSYSSRIEEIRASDLYRRQAEKTGWLKDSPQAALRDYNLLVMSKPFLLRWASKVNPFRTQYLMFVDAGHDCIGALKTDHLTRLRKLMGRMLVTFFNYHVSIGAETHGMPQEAYMKYVGPPQNASTTSCCRVGRGGIIGGTPAYIDVFSRLYNVALSQTLSDGYMGTEENILGMVSARFPDLFNVYENVRDNCDVFVDAGERDPQDKRIYVQGTIPDQWSVARHSFLKEGGHWTPIPHKLHRFVD